VQQLSGLDNTFLTMEAGGQLGHVGSLCMYDVSELAGGSLYAAMERTLRERMHLLPPYRRRLAEVPLNLDHPYWIEDPDFDLDFHLRHIAVPPPGDDEQLASLVARIHGRALDRNRPLWEMYVIEGLASGQVALYTKIHHCTIDGVSGAEMMQVLLDRVPEGAPVTPPKRPWVRATSEASCSSSPGGGTAMWRR
jgi:WS/DGAT/MGAT family acyltransferase